MNAQTTPRTVEALTRLDTAVDQLLTASLLMHGTGMLTPAQDAAIHQVLDLIDTDTMNALRWATGLNTADWQQPRNERPRPVFPRCSVCGEPVSEGFATHHLTCGLTDDPAGCEGHPAGPFDPMGETVYCDGSCAR